MRWLCRCDCGNTVSVQLGNLTHGRAKSCGCLQRKLASINSKKYAHKRAVDISGQRFGRLTAVECVGKKEQAGYLWRCVCDCGNEVAALTRDLRSGNTRSCGCWRNEKIGRINKTHGKSHKSRLYNVWNGMRQRCNDPNHKSYKNYGGRGILCCEKWNDFTAFETWAFQAGYDENAPYGRCTLDRIDVNGNYEPDNCRWIAIKEQASNKRKSAH